MASCGALLAKPTGNRREAGNAAGYDIRQGVIRVPAPEIIEKMVGPWELESQTWPTKSARSNLLSFRLMYGLAGMISTF